MSHPNIVIVLADDMGWGDLGCYGSAIPTPHIDALAARGVRATDCHAASAVCTPSRYALMTGRYAWRGPLKNFVLMGHGPALIEPERPTLANLLRTAGYTSGAFGKWHLGLGWRHRDGSVRDAFAPGARLHDDVETDFGRDVDYTAPFTGGPLDLGFDRFFGIAGSLDMPPYAFLDQDRTVGIPDREKPYYLTEQRPGLAVDGFDEAAVDLTFAAKAVDWIRSVPADQPFLCYVTPSAPHRPCVPPDVVRGASGLGDRADAVCLVDWMVGQLVAAVDERGQREQTLFIITSDNGAVTIFDDDGDSSVHRPNGDWRGQKGDLWDGGHREPFVANWPGRLPEGAVLDAPICLTDVLPTVAAATGVALPQGAAPDGFDLLDALAGDASAAPPADRPLVHHSLGGRFAIRRGPWKAIFAEGSGGGFSEPSISALFSSGSGKAHANPPWDRDHPQGQLYDVAADPGETVNLWHDRPEVVADLYQALRDICGDASSGLPFDVVTGPARA
ncbi:arylsulfatase [Catellatospora methionotrophica]|uniref:Arylsulfatase n=1 Tax=Catellatospora methionotrophica TaxID=121620 RepID=A0A8J3L5M7_9ACTN|nr:arylsulfatase [Catellatospora methionotrophica]GIG14918.1 arylsulfatase [Catellatospora methionotrophica]